MTGRRTFLQQLTSGTGSVLLASVCRRLFAEEELAETVPPRFVFVLEGNGLNPQQIHPPGIPFRPREERDVFRSFSLSGVQLPPALEPVADYRHRITILQGLSGRVAGGGHSNNFGALGAFNCKGGSGRSGQAVDVTIDANLGKKIGGIFPVVNLGISQNAADSVIYNSSCWGPGRKLPTFCDPFMAFTTLFGNSVGSDRRAVLDSQRDLLSFLRDDIRRAKIRLGSVDRQKLDVYLQACEELRARGNRLVDLSTEISHAAPRPDDKYHSGVETDRLDAHFEMAAAALISGLTNVVTIASGVGDPYFNVKFSGLDIPFGKHAIGHGGGLINLTADEMTTRIRRYHFELICRLMQKLERVPEGNHTMLDNTLIVYLSDAAEAHHSQCWEWPIVMLGDAGRRLTAGARYLSYPDYGRTGHRTVRNFYIALQQTVGIQGGFGHPDPNLRDLDQSGPLEELLG